MALNFGSNFAAFERGGFRRTTFKFTYYIIPNKRRDEVGFLMCTKMLFCISRGAVIKPGDIGESSLHVQAPIHFHAATCERS